ncbi:uncharacterized protein LOC141878737 isoform X3 [Acropora palmata]
MKMTHKIHDSLLSLEPFHKASPRQVFKRVFGRLDPSTHGKSFTQMQTILHVVQRERNVECKEIPDGFVLCGSLDEIKAVSIALESKLIEERSLTWTSLEEFNHAANVLTESKAVRKSLSTDGSVMGSVSEHDRLKTESSLLTLSSLDGHVEAQKISEKDNDGSSAVNTPFLESCNAYDSVSKTVEPIQSTAPTQENNQLALDERCNIIEGSDCKDRTDLNGDISGSESQYSVLLGDGSAHLSKAKIKALNEEEISKRSMENTETKESWNGKSVCKSPEKRKSRELSPQHRKQAPKKCKLIDSHDIQPCEGKLADESRNTIQSSSSTTLASNKAIYQSSLEEENRQVKSNIKDSENRRKQKTNDVDVGVENFEEFVTVTNLTIRLFVGDISRQQVDVILCPTNATISCSEGLTKMILDEGGQIIEEEFLRETKVKDEFKEGYTFITSSGELPSKAILHAVLPLWEPEKQIEKDVKRCIHRCLKDGLMLCSGHRLESIAIPPLGQPTNNIPIEVSAEIITRVVATFSRKIGPFHNGIKEVRVVAENDKSLETFVTNFLSFSFPDETPFFANKRKEAKSSLLIRNNAEASNFVSSETYPEAKCENKAANFNHATGKATEELPDVGSIALNNKAEGNGEIQADLSKQTVWNKDVRKGVSDNQQNAAVNSQREECEEMISSLANNPVQCTEVATMKAIQEATKTAHPDTIERKVVEEKILGSEHRKEEVTSHIDKEEKGIANAQSSGRAATEISRQPKHGTQSPKIKESLSPKRVGEKFRSRRHGNRDIVTNGTHDSPTPSNQCRLVASANCPAKPITSPTVENLLKADLCLGPQGLKLTLEEKLGGDSHKNGGPSREERILGEMEQQLSSCLAEGNHDTSLTAGSQQNYNQLIDGIIAAPLPDKQANQPPGEMVWKRDNESLPGFEGSATIAVSFHFYSGIQGTEHPNPGNEYKGTSYKAYLPETNEGKHIFKLLRKAFDARLLFTIVSSSDGAGCVGLKDIELKTSIARNSRTGYPDPSYLTRVRQQLVAKGCNTEHEEVIPVRSFWQFSCYRSSHRLKHFFNVIFKPYGKFVMTSMDASAIPRPFTTSW